MVAAVIPPDPKLSEAARLLRVAASRLALAANVPDDIPAYTETMTMLVDSALVQMDAALPMVLAVRETLKPS